MIYIPKREHSMSLNEIKDISNTKSLLLNTKKKSKTATFFLNRSGYYPVQKGTILMWLSRFEMSIASHLIPKNGQCFRINCLGTSTSTTTTTRICFLWSAFPRKRTSFDGIKKVRDCKYLSFDIRKWTLFVSEIVA